MGVVLSRLRKKKVTTEILEELDVEIKGCINFRLENQESQRRWLGRLTLWGLTVYALAVLIYFLVYFPARWVERVVYTTILVVAPVMVILASRRSLMWYYSRKITNNEEKLLLLKEEKERILEEVMENETYKKAKEILDKYDPERNKALTPSKAGVLSNLSTPGCEVRQRKGVNGLSTPKAPPPPSSAALAIGPPPSTPNASANPQNSKILRPPVNTPVRAPLPVRPGGPRMPQNFNTQRGPLMGSPMITRPPVLPRPVLQADRGVLDRMVEYLVGDGPTNRYALVCRRCHRHNGMALREEFEYLAYHCAYCQFLNPAKRKRPSAPRLPESNPPESDAGSESDFNVGASSSSAGPAKLPSVPSTTSVDEEKVEASEDAQSTVSLAESASAGAEPSVEDDDRGRPTHESTGSRVGDVDPVTEEANRDLSADSLPHTSVSDDSGRAEDADADSGAEVGITEDPRDESTDAMEVENMS